MDIITHAILAWVLARGFFSRKGWGVAAGMILAGTLADLDGISAWLGPGTFLRWHRTYTHSLAATVLIVAIGTVVTLRWGRPKSEGEREPSSHSWSTISGIVLAVASAVIAHLVMEFCQSDGVSLFWPITSRRFAADILPRIDPWILAVLILGIVVPELLRLVSSEIGAKDNIPRGRNGARVALALILAYTGTRYALHTNAMTQLDAHAYKGETPRRVGAFADALSVFTWHGIVETTSLMCTMEVAVGPGRVFDASAVFCQHKPDASDALAAAEKSVAARKFLRVARFPKATVEKREDGYAVTIREVQGAGESETRQRVAAQIELDAKEQVVEEELVWNEDIVKR